MQREDQFLEDVLKIFHNSKGSVRNTIRKWHNDERPETTDKYLRAEWKPYPNIPFNHAAGQYEPLSIETKHVPKHRPTTEEEHALFTKMEIPESPIN